MRSTDWLRPAKYGGGQEEPKSMPEFFPGYWINETSGVLRPAVEAYLAGDPLSDVEIAALRAYFRQWITSSVWDANPYVDVDTTAWLAGLRAGIDGLTSRKAIEDWLDEAVAGGMDPL